MTWTIMYTMQDEKTETSTTEVNLPDATSLADAVLYAQELAKLIDPIITGAIVRIGLSKTVAVPGTLDTTADSGSDVEEGARFQFRTSGGFYSGMRLATFDEANISAGSRVVATNANTTAFINALVSGINLTGVGGSGTIQPCDKRDEDLTALEFAREQFLSSRS